MNLFKIALLTWVVFEVIAAPIYLSRPREASSPTGIALAIAIYLAIGTAVWFA